MRGYYYDQDDLRPDIRPAPPAAPPPRPRRRGGGTAVLLFLCTLLVLIGGTVLLKAWDASRLAEVTAQFRQEGRPARLRLDDGGRRGDARCRHHGGASAYRRRHHPDHRIRRR